MIRLEPWEQRGIVEYDTHRRCERESEGRIIEEREWWSDQKYIANQEQYRQARHSRLVLYGEECYQPHDRRAHDWHIPADKGTIEEYEYNDNADTISTPEGQILQYTRDQYDEEGDIGSTDDEDMWYPRSSEALLYLLAHEFNPTYRHTEYHACDVARESAEYMQLCPVAHPIEKSRLSSR
jgi:hypothetical protein